MERVIGLALVAIGLVAGCTDAKAVQIDPSNDAHCALLTTAGRVVGIQQKASAKEMRAVVILDDWYAVKLAALGKSAGERERLLAELAPLISYVETKPLGTFKRELMACTDRAIADPTFNGFVRAQGK